MSNTFLCARNSVEEEQDRQGPSPLADFVLKGENGKD